MTYEEAKKLAHEQRINMPDRRLERALGEVNMLVEQREELGALFHEYADSVSIQIDNVRREYTIPTIAGPLAVRYDPRTGTIFGRFTEEPQVAAKLLLHVNPHSGKWNIHTNKSSVPAEVFANWKRQVECVRVKWLVRK